MEFLSSAILLFLIMDPLGNIPVFMSVLKTVPAHRRQKVLIRELLISLAIMVLFLFAGQALLNLLGLRQDSVSIAGGIILFLIAIRMIFPKPGGVMGHGEHGEPFIVPLAIPLTAGPSILATLILMANHADGHYLNLLMALIIAWTLSSIILLSSNYLYKLVGDRGLIATERLMGMILVMLSVQMFLDGIAHYFQISTVS